VAVFVVCNEYDVKVYLVKKFMLVMFVSVLAIAACGGNKTSSNPNQNAALATVPPEYEGLTNPLGADAAGNGADVFNTNCQTCHGPQGHGDGPAGQALVPPPGNLAELQTKVGDDFLYWRIREGKPGTAMVAWKGILTDEQIWQTVSFIRSLKE
jgi:mono/diheme cytochrome c family protein